MLPEEVAKKTLGNTTHYYLSVEAENRQDPRSHCKYHYPGLSYPLDNKKQWYRILYFLKFNLPEEIPAQTFLLELHLKDRGYIPLKRKSKME